MYNMCVCAYIHLCISVDKYIYIHKSIDAPVPLSSEKHLALVSTLQNPHQPAINNRPASLQYTYTCTYTHTHTHLYIHIYTHVYIYTYTHTCIHIHIHTRVHTCTPSHRLCTTSSSTTPLGLLRPEPVASSSASTLTNSTPTVSSQRTILS